MPRFQKIRKLPNLFHGDNPGISSDDILDVLNSTILVLLVGSKHQCGPVNLHLCLTWGKSGTVNFDPSFKFYRRMGNSRPLAIECMGRGTGYSSNVYGKISAVPLIFLSSVFVCMLIVKLK